MREMGMEEKEDTAWSWRIEGVSGHKKKREEGGGSSLFSVGRSVFLLLFQSLDEGATLKSPPLPTVSKPASPFPSRRASDARKEGGWCEKGGLCFHLASVAWMRVGGRASFPSPFQSARMLEINTREREEGRVGDAGGGRRRKWQPPVFLQPKPAGGKEGLPKWKRRKGRGGSGNWKKVLQAHKRGSIRGPVLGSRRLGGRKGGWWTNNAARILHPALVCRREGEAEEGRPSRSGGRPGSTALTRKRGKSLRLRIRDRKWLYPLFPTIQSKSPRRRRRRPFLFREIPFSVAPLGPNDDGGGEEEAILRHWGKEEKRRRTRAWHYFVVGERGNEVVLPLVAGCPEKTFVARMKTDGVFPLLSFLSVCLLFALSLSRGLRAHPCLFFVSLLLCAQCTCRGPGTPTGVNFWAIRFWRQQRGTPSIP